jgi:hypothetical protein
MLTKLRNHLTYANVVSTLCLFILLGGSAFAATRLSRNSVRSKHIKNNQVQSVDVKNASLLEQDFAPGQLPAGPQGPKGDQGASAPEAWAVYNAASDTIVGGRGVTSITPASIDGQYRVVFDRPVRGDPRCAIFARDAETAGAGGSNPNEADIGPPGTAAIRNSTLGGAEEVMVAIHTAAGANNANGHFVIAAFC